MVPIIASDYITTADTFFRKLTDDFKKFFVPIFFLKNGQFGPCALGCALEPRNKIILRG